MNKTNNTDEKTYEDFSKKLEKLTDEGLINVFINDLGKSGWVRSRGIFLAALHEEFKKRGIDSSKITK